MEIDIITFEQIFEILSLAVGSGFILSWVPWFVGMVVAVFKKIILS